MTVSRRRLTAVSIVVVIVGLLVSERIHAGLVSVLASAQSVAVSRPWAAAIFVVSFAAVGAMAAFVSSWIVLPFAVFTWGPIQALGLLWSGWFLGGVACYAIGRYLGRPAVGWLASPDVLRPFEERVSQRSAFGLILLLQLGLPSEVPGYLLGLVRYPFGWYLVALGTAELVHGVPAVLLGAGLVERRGTVVGIVALTMIVLTLTAANGLRRRLAVTAPQSANV